MDSYVTDYDLNGQPEMSGKFLHWSWLPTAFPMVSAEFADRPLKTLCLFDVDGTLTLARKVRFFLASYRVCT